MKNVKLHCFINNTKYYSRGNKIYSNENGIYKHVLDIKLNFTQKLKSCNVYIRRLFRTEIYNITPVNNKIIIINGFNQIISFNLYKKKIINVFRLRNKTLNICKAGNKLYFGEYHFEKNKASFIWCSKDYGNSWEKVFEFNNIRHIHGVFYDKFQDKLVVTTGDKNTECIICYVDITNGNVMNITSGDQQSRAITLLITDKYIYYGTDTPLEINYIYRIDKKTNYKEKLFKIPGSVFWGTLINEKIYFSTAIEPSKVNSYKNSTVWEYNELTKKHRCIAEHKRSILSLKYFQYPQIIFPQYYNKIVDGNLYYTTLHTVNHMKIHKVKI